MSHDLFGHPEAVALRSIIGPGCIADINDGFALSYQQPTPRARILAALHDIKSKAEQAMEAYEDRPLVGSTRELVR